ncbi:hypothetical protein HQ394_13430 [Defluviicoccus vanus]|uniref:Ig-like domain-containing protein n=1 Tax=Defluviicoccus vanus TaxID=111831 RepID=A0A7H1N361_9PROT|nr:hypothetical protein HQ394_13430 [Defluviicoccus vanus]
MQAAISAAADGDTVNVPACTGVTWSTTLSMPSSKGIRLIGAGSDKTIITLTGGIDAICSAGKPHRISGFQFKDKTSGTAISLSGTCSSFRVDHNIFSNFAPSVEGIVIDWFRAGVGPIYGVIDHNTFKAPLNHRTVLIYGLGQTWPSFSPLGSAQNIYIEDNTLDFGDITNGTAGMGCADANYGAYFVWRHNTSRNCLLSIHGDYNNAGGVVSTEVYENSFKTDGPSNFWPDGYRLVHHQGSGDFMIFNNTFSAPSGKSVSTISLTHYRSCPGYGARCDGSSSVDENRQPTATYKGYACLHQPGRKWDRSLSPNYSWNNRWSDSNGVVNIGLENPFGGCSNPDPFTHVKPDRDYYNFSTSFSGASGVGMGTLANRPTTCATNANEAGGGVGYWATDTETLYRCSATNTWTAHYQPYQYPHPLVSTSSADTTPPSVALSSPASGATVSGAVTLAANASDNVGVASVQFRIDGANLNAADTNVPYSVVWNTTSVANGAHAVTALARDAAGNATTSAAVNVTVSNGVSAPSIVQQPQGASVNLGQSATFSVIATGASPLAYQWQANGINISGASAPSYTTPPTTSSDAGKTFRVKVTNTVGAVTSNDALLSVRSDSTVIGSYKFDEGSGAVAVDSSGNNRNGTLVNGPTRVTGKNGAALRFDGANDYVTIGNQTLPSTFTLSVWINNPSNAPCEAIASFGTYREFALCGGSLCFGDNTSPAHEFGAVPTGSWQHVAFTYDGTNLRAYLNGSPLGAAWNKSLTAASGLTSFGAWPYLSGGFGDYLSASLDDLKIYNRAFSQSEIQTVMNQSIASAARVVAAANAVSSTASATSSPAIPNTMDKNVLHVSAVDAASVGDRWRSVEVPLTSGDGVVIAGPPTTSGSRAGVVRVNNVDRGGFDLRLQPLDDATAVRPAASVEENVPYLVVEPGRGVMGDGSIWEVGTFPLSGADAWKRIAFRGAFSTTPFVFLTIQTANDWRGRRRLWREKWACTASTPRLLKDRAKKKGTVPRP